MPQPWGGFGWPVSSPAMKRFEPSGKKQICALMSRPARDRLRGCGSRLLLERRLRRVRVEVVALAVQHDHVGRRLRLRAGSADAVRAGECEAADERRSRRRADGETVRSCVIAGPAFGVIGIRNALVLTSRSKPSDERRELLRVGDREDAHTVIAHVLGRQLLATCSRSPRRARRQSAGRVVGALREEDPERARAFLPRPRCPGGASGVGSPSPSASTASANGSSVTCSVPVGVEPGGSRSLVRLKSRSHGAATQSCGRRPGSAASTGCGARCSRAST